MGGGADVAPPRRRAGRGGRPGSMDAVGSARVGVVGPGVMGRHHIAVWRDLGVDVCAYAPRPEEREAVREGYGIAVHDDLDALLGSVEIVDVCTPTGAHRDVVVAAARAGRHVICEKPLALTLAGAEAMRGACAAAGVRLQVGHVVRFFPDYALAKRTVDEGGIGRPAVLRLARTAVMPPASSWFADEARSGGVAYDLMIHDLDYARWVAGDIVRVFARVRRPEAGGAPVRAYALLTHAGGALSHVQATWGLPGTAFTTSFEIAGSGGLLSHDAGATEPLRAALRAEAPEAGEDGYLPPVGAGDDPYALELGELYAAIVDGTPARVTADDGVEAVRLAVAVAESARTGAPVELNGAVG